VNRPTWPSRHTVERLPSRVLFRTSMAQLKQYNGTDAASVPLGATVGETATSDEQIEERTDGQTH